MKKLFLIIGVFVLLISSCTIKQEYQFNDDFSGTAISTVDMSMLMGFMQGQMAEGEQMNMKDTLEKSLVAIAEQLKIVGATNIKYSWDNEISLLSISYDFSDIELLNKALSNQNATGDILKGINASHATPSFSNKGKKKVIYHAAKLNKDAIKDVEQMESMKDYYKYELVIKFNKKIKKHSSKNAKLSADGKSISLEGSLFDLFDPELNTDIDFKLQ